MSLLSELQPSGGGAGGSVERVASGALSNGDTVVINSDGTVSVVTGTDHTESLGSWYGADRSGITYLTTEYDSANQRVILAYISSSNRVAVTVGTVSGSVISFGSEYLSEQECKRVSCVFMDDVGKLFIAFTKTYSSNYGYCVVASFSGTTVSFGSAYVFLSQTLYDWTACAYDSDQQKVVIAVNAGSACRAVLCSVSGDTVTVHGATSFNAYGGTGMSADYSSTTGKVVIGYKQTNAAPYCPEVVIGSVSGTSISFGSVLQLTNYTVDTYLGVSCSTESNKFAITWNDDADTFDQEMVIGTISGTSATFGSMSIAGNQSSGYGAIMYIGAANKVVVAWRSKISPYKAVYSIGTVNADDSVTFGSEANLSSGENGNYIDMALDPTNMKVMIAYKDNGDYGYTGGRIYSPAYTETNLTASNFIGIADADYTDGSTATIQSHGSVNESQTGLTAGQAYYVQTDGTLSTTAGSPEVFAGTAISSTKIIVGG